MSIISRFNLFYYTLKPLRWQQVIYRVKARFFPPKALVDPPLAIASSWCWQGPEVLQPSLLADNKVSYLNVAADITDARSWNNPSFEKLWLYNLHYFDDLNAINSLSRKDIQLRLVNKWISENPLLIGNGWEPYPLSLRLVNWIKWYKRAGISDHNILKSIHLQAQALSKQLEYHILGNHLFANAKALVFVGCFLQGEDAERYLRLGLRILKREIPEQFLADGGHFELSPMYHCILLWDLLDLINLAEISNNKEVEAELGNWRRYANNALNWLNVMIQPDQEVTFFNDSTIGIAAAPSEIFQYANQLKLDTFPRELPALITLNQSGYSRVNMPAHTLFFDHAAVGPDYLPGHAHADSLSLEWSVGTQRVLVNSGTSVYGVSEERLRQRKTAAHNTVEVDGEDSSEVWSGFRVARRAYCNLLKAELLNDLVILEAEHDGYQRLPGKVRHRREIVVSPDEICVTDSIQGRFHQATVHWHLHPDIAIVQSLDQELLLCLPNDQKLKLDSSGSISIEDSTWHPGFGVSLNSKKLLIKVTNSPAISRIRLL